MLHSTISAVTHPYEHVESGAVQEAAALLARAGWHPRPVTVEVPRDWLWDGLSAEGRQRLIDSWVPPGLRLHPVQGH